MRPVVSWKLIFPVGDHRRAVPAGCTPARPGHGHADRADRGGDDVHGRAGLEGDRQRPAVAADRGRGAVHHVRDARLPAQPDPDFPAIPSSDPSGDGYHIVQSKIALGSGGLLGKGFGLGSRRASWNFLPEKQTDFIFATLAEEFGFVGSFRPAAPATPRSSSWPCASPRSAHSHFGRMAAAGVTSTFALYVMINGAMVMGLAPVVGVPMPMLSYGGTVMLTVMVGFGLVHGRRACTATPK
jgi:hypothetical protein